MQELKPENDNFDEGAKELFDDVEAEEVESPRPKYLRKSKKNSLIAGVCSGIAEYFNIEPVIVRIFFVISILLGGWGIIAYILAAILLPSGKTLETETKEEPDNSQYVKTMTGGLFVFLGLFFVADSMGVLEFFFLFGLPRFFILPFVFVIAGIFIIIKRKNFFNYDRDKRLPEFRKHLTDKRISGVCGGLAKYMNIGSNNLRISWIVLTFLTAGTGILIYLLLAFITPEDSEAQIEI